MIPVWTWRDAIRKSNVPPLTKHICNCIANYVNDVGAGAFPSVRSLIADSGMSNRSVATHLQNAVDAKLLTIEREKGADGRHKRSTYFPRFPDDVVLKRQATRAVERPDDEFDPREGASLGDDHVKDAHLDRPDEGASLGPREENVVHHVKELHANSPVVELSTHTPTPQQPGRRVGVIVDNPVERLRASGEYQHVVEGLIAPLWGAIQFKGGDPDVWLKSICVALAGRTAEVIEQTCDLIRTRRSVWPTAAQAVKLADEAYSLLPVFQYPEGSIPFRAWCQHYRHSGMAFMAKLSEDRGYVAERGPVPPPRKRVAA